MIPFTIFLLFVLLMRWAVKTRDDYLASLFLFSVACSVKIAFLLWWVVYQTGEYDLEYLHFTDEHFYVEYHLGDPHSLFGKAYCLVVYIFQCLGFTYFDLKLFNIAATSFALVRLYSLNDLVRYKATYFWLLLCFGGILHIHVIYYSVFILKDGLIFLFSMELFVQLVRRKSANNTRSILAVILILSTLRSHLVYLFGLLLFDNRWRVDRFRMFALACVLLVLLPVVYEYSEAVIVQRVSVGLQYGADINPGERVAKSDVRELIRRNPGLFIKLALINIKNVLSPFHQTEVTGMLILLEFYASILYLLLINRISIWSLWPILMFPFALLVVIILTSATIRWAMYPFSTLIYAFVFLACHPPRNIVRCGSRSLGVGRGPVGHRYRGEAVPIPPLRKKVQVGVGSALPSLRSFETLRPEPGRRSSQRELKHE